MDTKIAIKNLETLSRELEKACLKSDIYNTDFGYYLGIISSEINKQARNLKHIDETYHVYTE